MARLLHVLAIIFTGGLIYVFNLRRLETPKNRLKHAGFHARRVSHHQDFSLGHFFEKHPQAYLLIALIILSLFFTPWLSKYRFLFQASLIDLPSVEFTGTTYPVKKVPVWTELTDAERLLSYSQLPKHKLMDLPDYDLRAMQAGTEWAPDNAYERNIYITYPVPNLGNYRLDGTENSGSHPGIDIKIPTGTPVHSIASGIVYKTGDIKTGFGKSVSVAHVGVPDPTRPGKTTTLVSTYAHLSRVNVKEGDQIRKDQIIGLSGNTGFSTNPHLHFQVDRMDAPFIPYWPFSWKDVQAAGLNSYFDGVRYSVGKQNALKYTVHPFNLIAANLDSRGEPLLVAFDDTAQKKEPTFDYVPTKPELVEPAPVEFVSSAPKVEPSPTPVVKPEPKPEPVHEPDPAPAIDPTQANPSQVELAQTANVAPRQSFKRGQLKLEFETDRSYTPGKEEVVKVYINEANLVASAGILVSSTLKDRADVYPSKLMPDDFEDGVAEVRVKTYSSFPFKIVAKSDYGEIKSQSLRPEIFSDVPGDHTFAMAINFLKENGVVRGYDDNTYRPDQTLNRAEALKIILEANKIKAYPENAPFSDISDRAAWYYNYVTTAFKRSIVKGYGDGTFKPGNTVSRAEFIKMAIATAGFSPDMDLVRNPYSDVQTTDWHAKYFEFAKGQSLLRPKSGNLMAPNAPITRGEAAEVIYKLSKVQKR